MNTTGPPARTLVVDENLNKRLATELLKRGRDAVRVSALNLSGTLDPLLLDKLDAQLDDWVLVTADDALPDAHAEAVAKVGATVATIDTQVLPGWGIEAWRCEIVHRWAHHMHELDAGQVRRYSLHRHHTWKPRRRRPRPH